MMRSWENRADTEVIDEPLYAWYLDHTQLDHPGREEIVEAGPARLGDAIQRCLASPVPNSSGPEFTVSYQKHMAGHLLASVDRTWLDGLEHGLLLRDPRRVLASYTKVRKAVTLDDIGLPQQVELAERCSVIVDSGDFLTDPEGYTRLICERFDVDFDPAMLTWPAGRRDSDGVWSRHWYTTVERSTGFGPAPVEPPPQLPPHLRQVANEAWEIYTDLHARRSTI